MANFPPPSSPTWEKWERLADEWPVVEGPDFADGGRDYFSPTLTTPIRRWRISYVQMTLAEAQILDDWYAANRGSGLTFTFTDRDSTAYGNVRCVGYERDHERPYALNQFRVIEFEDRP